MKAIIGWIVIALIGNGIQAEPTLTSYSAQYRCKQLEAISITLPYSHTTIDPFPITYPLYPAPTSWDTLSYPMRYTSGSPVAPVTVVIDTIPDHTLAGIYDLISYDYVTTVRGAHIRQSLLPYALTSFNLLFQPYRSSHQQQKTFDVNITYHLVTSTTRSESVNITIIIDNTYQPVQFRQSLYQWATVSGTLSTIPLLDTIQFDAGRYSSNDYFKFIIQSLPDANATLYAISSQSLSTLNLAVPPSWDPYTGTDMSIPSTLSNEMLSQFQATARLISLDGNNNSIKCSTTSCEELLVLLSPLNSSTNTTVSFVLSIDDGWSSVSLERCRHGLRALLNEQLSVQPLVLSAIATQILPHSLSCSNRDALASQCFITLRSLPLYGMLYIDSLLTMPILTVPFWLSGANTLFYRPANASTTLLSDSYLYSISNGVSRAVSNSVSLTISPAFIPPHTRSFSIRTIDYDEISITLFADSQYVNRSHSISILSLPNSTLGLLSALYVNGSREVISEVPYALEPPRTTSIIFSPCVDIYGSSIPGATAFRYQAFDTIANYRSEAGIVDIYTGPYRPPPVTVSSTLETTQFDPLLISLMAIVADEQPHITVITTLPLYGTLFRSVPLPSYVWTQSTLLRASFEGDSSVGNLFNLSCLDSAFTDQLNVNCLPESLREVLIPLNAHDSVIDPMHQVIYIPHAQSYALDSFSFRVSDSFGQSSLDAHIDIAINRMNTPPIFLPPVVTHYKLAEYLPTPSHEWHVFMFAGTSGGVSFQLQSFDATPSQFSYFLSALPADTNGWLYYLDVSTWIQIKTGNDTHPFQLPSPVLLYQPLQASDRSSYAYLQDSLEVFVSDGDLSSERVRLLLSVVPYSAIPSCNDGRFAVAVGESLLLPISHLVDDNPSTIVAYVDSLPALGQLYQTRSDGLALRSGLIVAPHTAVADSLLKLTYQPFDSVYTSDVSFISTTYLSSRVLPPFNSVYDTNMSLWTDRFVYHVYDASTGLSSAFCTVAIDVLQFVNRSAAPSFIVTTAEHTSVVINFPCVDNNSSSCVFTITSPPIRGSLMLCTAPNTTVSLSTFPFTLLKEPSIQNGTLAMWDLCYMPHEFEHGNPITYNFYSSFTYVLESPSLGRSLDGTVTVAVTQMNIPPVLLDKNITMDEDGMLVIDLSASDADPSVSYTVWVSSMDLRGRLFQFDARNPSSPAGQLINTTRGPAAVSEREANGEPGTGSRVVFVPDTLTYGANHSHFSYYASDAYQSDRQLSLVTINVQHVNHKPVANPLSFTIDSGFYATNDVTLFSPGVNQVLVNFSNCCSDLDGNSIFVAITGLPTRGDLYHCPEDDPMCYVHPSTRIAITRPVESNLTAAVHYALSGTLQDDVRSAFIQSTNSIAYFTMDNSGGFYPYLNFSYVAFDLFGGVSESSVTILLKCGPGLVPNLLSDRGDVCVTCPIGAQCSTDGTFTPYALSGFFAMPVERGITFVPCHPAAACSGGYFPDLDPDLVCAQGYTGLMCGTCQPGFFHLESSCVRCPSRSLFLTALICAIVVIFVLLTLAALSKHRISFACLFIITTLFQTLSIYNNYNLRWPSEVHGLFTVMSFTSFNLDLLAPSCFWPAITYSHIWIATLAAVPVFALLMLMIHCVLCLRAWWSMTDQRAFMKYVSHLTAELLRYVTFLLCLSFLPVLSKSFQLFNCSLLPNGSVIFNADASLLCTDTWRMNLVPFSIVAIVLFTLFVFIWLGGGISKHIPKNVVWHRGRLTTRQKLIRSADGSKPLLDPSNEANIVTWSLPHSPLPDKPLPTLRNTAISLSRSKHTRSTFSVDDAFAFLTAPFKPVYFYWYLVCLLRLLLLAVSCMLYPDLPIVAATFSLAVLVIASILQAALLPYSSTSLNLLEQTSLLVSSFILFCGVIFKGDETSLADSSLTSPLSTSFVVFIFVSFFLCLFFFSFIFFRKIEKLLFCRRCRRVPPLRIKSAALIMKVGKRLHQVSAERRDLLRVKYHDTKPIARPNNIIKQQLITPQRHHNPLASTGDEFKRSGAVPLGVERALSRPLRPLSPVAESVVPYPIRHRVKREDTPLSSSDSFSSSCSLSSSSSRSDEQSESRSHSPVLTYIIPGGKTATSAPRSLPIMQPIVSIPQFPTFPSHPECASPSLSSSSESISQLPSTIPIRGRSSYR